MRIAFYTLGCKVNQFETQAMEIISEKRGHEVVSFDAQADAYVINTCTVTGTSDKKSRQHVRKTRRAHPESIIAVCGCFPQVDTEKARELECADVICGSAQREKLIELVEKAYSDREKSELVDVALKRREYEDLPSGGLSGHTRAMLKIQDGCSNFCTYCIIPYARGPVRSMKVETAIEEVRKLREAGYREIVVTGIEIASYGKDLKNGENLCSLLEKILKEAPDIRFRLGSLEPRIIDDEFCKKLSKYPNLCPQFHLSMQSGCDETLKRMRRKYDTARYLQSVEMLNKSFRNCAITTDLIVGFPGESEEEFLTTLEFIKKCRFSALHIFPYSKRKGTPAATMPVQIELKEKTSRAKRAGQVAKDLENAYLDKYVGECLEVLFEEEQGGMWTGHSENYLRVFLESESDLKNQMCTVKIIGKYKDGLLGGIV